MATARRRGSGSGGDANANAGDEGGSAAFGRIIADNARERRQKAKALRDQGRTHEYVLWPSSAEAAAAQSATAGPSSSSTSSASGSGSNSSERTAHLLLRVLCLCFVVPLSRLGEDGEPSKVARHGCNVGDALDTLEQMMQVRPDLLDDIFASRPGATQVASTSANAAQQLTSTTFDVWICPRLLAAASVLTLRSCGILPLLPASSNDASSSSSPASLHAARRRASSLRSKMLLAIKRVLRTSLLKTNHLESVRAMLWETLKVALRALSRTDDVAPLALGVSPSPNENDDESSSSRAVLSFFENGSLPEGCKLSRTKRKAHGDGIARLWLEEDHAPYRCSWDQEEPRPPPAKLHALVHSYVIAACDVCLDMALEFPQVFSDVGAAAGKLLVETWSKDDAYRRAQLPGRGVGPELQAVRLDLVARCLEQRGSDALLQMPCLVELVVSSLSFYIGATSSNSKADDSNCVAFGQALRRVLHQLRLHYILIPSQSWSELRLLAPTLLKEMATRLPAQSDEDPSGAVQAVQESGGAAEAKARLDELLARKLCAFEAMVVMVSACLASQTTAIASPLTSQQEQEFASILAIRSDEDKDAGFEGDEEEPEPCFEWLTEHEVQEARHFLKTWQRRRDAARKDKRKRGDLQDGDEDPDGDALEPCFNVETVCFHADVNRERDVWDAQDPATATTDKAMEMAGQFICAEAGGLQYRRYTRHFSCEVCDAAEHKGKATIVQPLHAQLGEWLRALHSYEPFRQLGLLEYARRAIAHAEDNGFLQLTAAIEAALQVTFSHRAREVRLAAGRLAFAYVARHCRVELGDEAVRPLRARVKAAIELHGRNLAPSSRVKVKETTIISLGQLGKLKTEEVQREALLALVLELNGSILLQSCAYLQITQLAAYHRCSTYALLSPHFAAISPPIVERMTSAPGLFLEVLQLTNQNQAKFLQATIAFTLPVVIASKNTKALSLMVSALGTTVPKLCLEQAPAILKKYLLQNQLERDRNIKTYLDTMKRASDHDVSLRQLYRSYNGEILGHLTATLGDPERRTVAIEGLRHIEATLKTTPTSASSTPKESSRPSTKLGNDLSAFLKDEILGILAWLNDDLMSVNGKKSPTFKAMVARSIGVFIEVVGHHISLVAPQIMATLSSTLQVPELRLATLSSWKTFMTTLRFEEIGAFIGQTTAALLSQWDQFTAPEKKVAKSMLTYLIVDNAQMMRDHIAEIPNLDCLASEIPELCRKVRAWREAWTPEQQLAQILDRVTDENASISLTSLRELNAFMGEHQAFIQQAASGTVFAPIVSKLVAALLNTMRRSEELQVEVRDLCLECLGKLGAVDPDRLEMASDDSPHKLLQNFEDREETIDFAVHLIRDILVSAFRASSDTKHQAALAYAIQELLAFCGFTSLLLRPTGRNVSLKVKQRWHDLPQSVVETVAPLLNSKYSITHGPPTEHPKPFYAHSTSYRDWIEIWANHLMQGAKGGDAQRIFSIFRVLLRHHDLDITQHILPHAVLHNLISGTDTQRQELREEFVAVLTDQVDPTTEYSSDRRLLCAQTVFALMDHLSAWLRLKRQERYRQPTRQQRRDAAAGNVVDEAGANVQSVLDSISQELMARASLQCRAYARSLLNFELRIRELRQTQKQDRDLQSYYEQLHVIYADIDEPDGMEGISTRIISPSIEHQIREHETTGRWTSAQSCWEVQIQGDPGEAANHVGLVRCLRNLGHYDTMRTHVRGALSLNPQWEDMLAPFAIEGACILGDWDEARNLLQRRGDTDDSPQAATARVLLQLEDSKEGSRFDETMRQALRQLGKPILAAGRNSYPQVYESILQLHILSEVAMIREATVSNSKANLAKLQTRLSARLDATLPSFRIREPLLSVRRTAFSISSADNRAVADAWISTCKIARKAKHTQTAYSAALQARVSGAPFAFVQTAKLLASSDQPHAAIQELNHALQTLHPAYQAANATGVIDLTNDDGSPSASSNFDRRAYANAHLLRARLCEETGRFHLNEVIERYKKCTEIDKHSEKMHYYLGRYYDASEVGNGLVLKAKVVHYFLRSAQLGTKYFYRTMPRVLTIWFDAGDDPVLIRAVQRGGLKKMDRRNPEEFEKMQAFEAITNLINGSVRGLQPYQWLAALPQLVSRIPHKNDMVWPSLRNIIARIVNVYTPQAMWGIIAAFHSSDSVRRKRAHEIVEAGKTKENWRTIDSAQRLASELLHLCNYPAPKSNNASFDMVRDFPKLVDLAACDLILPLQSSVVVNLPADNIPRKDHLPFPSDLPRITGWEPTIEIMNSLQKPRKIVAIGSDGARYAFLCKPKDDLRKDARLMEFDAMINKLLQASSDSRKRRLLVRTYGVQQLNEECGLIEWVPNTVGLRHILQKLYGGRGIHMFDNNVRANMDEARTTPRTGGKIFEQKVLSVYPPVFHEWFVSNFPEPAAWLKARHAFARTCAVMSMVGWVLGLGDRHGENILFDSMSGDTVHVDLNCLFEKGATFEIPETVPFRLTHNLVDAMGVCGYEGVFRRAAEITMGILRTNKDSLTSVLEAMVHDPLVEWGGGASQGGGNPLPVAPKAKAPAAAAAAAPSVAAQGKDPRVVAARLALDPVGRKLDGCHRPAGRNREPWGLPQSTPNLVDLLIREATSSDNLAKVYVGWASWL